MSDCARPEGHEWQLLTRHADPPGYEGVLTNAICAHCSEQTAIDIEAEACCQVCMGMGVYPVHADTCSNDLCSFGVGEFDCTWQMVDCDVCGVADAAEAAS